MIFAQETLTDEIIVDNFAGGGGASRSREFARWPKYQDAYMRALQHYLDKHPKQAAKGDIMSWWHWWMEDGIISGQMDLLGGRNDAD